MVRLRNPVLFFPELEKRCGGDAGTPAVVRATWSALERVARQGNGADQVSIDAIRGALLSRLDYLERARAEMERALTATLDEDERIALLVLLYDTCARQGDWTAAAGTRERLKKIEGLADEVDSLLSEHVPPGPPWPTPLGIAFWLILLVFPLAVLEWERRLWLEAFPPERSQIRAFAAFRRSPLLPLLALASAILAILFKLPVRGDWLNGPGFALVHLVLAYGLGLLPHYWLDRVVRGAEHGFVRFLLSSFRLWLLGAAHLLVIVPALLILRGMVLALPLWPVISPLGPGLGFPALTAALFLFIAGCWPLILGLRNFAAGEKPGWADHDSFRGVRVFIWDVPESRISRAIGFGSFTFQHGIGLTDTLIRQFPSNEVEAIALRESAPLVLGHRFLGFLVYLDGLLLVGLLAAWQPLAAQRFLLAGPGLAEAALLIGIAWILGHFLSRLTRLVEEAADRHAADRCGREVAISAFARLNRASCLPERWREGEDAGAHPSLRERKLWMRMRDGEPFEPSGNVDPSLLIALWRGRLGVDWNAGEDEAAHLCAIDYEVSSHEPGTQLRELARRHAGFGAEVLVRTEGHCLEVLSCAQKTAVGHADPPLPAEKVCRICSCGMKAALGGAWEWTGNLVGCRLETPRRPS